MGKKKKNNHIPKTIKDKAMSGDQVAMKQLSDLFGSEVEAERKVKRAKSPVFPRWPKKNE